MLEQLAREMQRLGELGGSIGPAGLGRWEAQLREVLAAEERCWLSEERAVRRSGKKAGWFRMRRRGWVEDGYARRSEQGMWEYHEAVVPRARFQPRPADDPVEQARRDVAA